MPAEKTVPAVLDQAPGHSVAYCQGLARGIQPRLVVRQLADGADALVPQNDGNRRRAVSGVRMQITAAECRQLEANQDLSRRYGWQRYHPLFQRSAGSQEDHGPRRRR